MEDKYSFVISQHAQTDLENIYEYISEVLLNRKAADDLMEAFLESFKKICVFPFSCEAINNEYVRDHSLRKLLVKNYIAFYRIKDKQIQIIRVLFGMSNYQYLL